MALIDIGLLRLPRNSSFKSCTEYVAGTRTNSPFSISTKSTRSPGRTPSADRTLLGIVIVPLEV